MKLRTTNSKAIWNILNSSKIDSNCAVNIEDMFDFLNDINERNLDADDYNELICSEVSDGILNSEIGDS